jgi:hypothetical protein
LYDKKIFDYVTGHSPALVVSKGKET